MNICPYLDEVSTLVAAEYSDLWREFSSDDYQLEQSGRVELDLLRRTEALKGPYATRISDLSQEVAKTLDVDGMPFFLHQPQGEATTVPRLCFIIDEVHLVVSPSELARLSDEQIRAVVAHEVTHHWLWTIDDGRYRHTELLLAALGARGDRPGALETERNYRRFSELVCDRGALRMERDVQTLASAIWELEDSGENRADEDGQLPSLEFLTEATTPSRNQGGSHPSWAMRCWAADRYLEKGDQCEAEVRQAIVGDMSMEHLCLLQQRELSEWSRWVLSRLTEPNWMQTERVLGHTTLFFPDGLESPRQEDPSRAENEAESREALVERINQVEDEGIRDYLAYVTLDVATVDRSLEHYPVAWALEVWDRIAWSDHLRGVVSRELKIGKRRMQQMHRERADIVSEAAEKLTPN